MHKFNMVPYLKAVGAEGIHHGGPLAAGECGGDDYVISIAFDPVGNVHRVSTNRQTFMANGNLGNAAFWSGKTCSKKKCLRTIIRKDGLSPNTRTSGYCDDRSEEIIVYLRERYSTIGINVLKYCIG